MTHDYHVVVVCFSSGRWCQSLHIAKLADASVQPGTCILARGFLHACLWTVLVITSSMMGHSAAQADLLPITTRVLLFSSPACELHASPMHTSSEWCLSAVAAHLCLLHCAWHRQHGETHMVGHVTLFLCDMFCIAASAACQTYLNVW